MVVVLVNWLSDILKPVHVLISLCFCKKLTFFEKLGEVENFHVMVAKINAFASGPEK